MAKVSVIVPVYNGESYLEKCLDSLVNQTLKELEIIVINDGSTDKTENILKTYQRQYSKIKVITKKNEGIAKARNDGLKQATGDYIAFVDSDDFVEVDMFNKLYQKITSLNYDFVECLFNFHYPDHDEDGVVDLTNDILSLADFKKYFRNLYPVVWNKLYKKSLLEGIYFEDVYAEDVEFLYRILPKASKIGLVNERLYYYFQREKSESKVYDERLFDYVKNFNSLYTYYQENNYYAKFKLEFEFVYVRYLYATFLKRSCTLNSKLALKAYQLAKFNVKEKFPFYRKNKYFYQSLKGLYLVTFNKFYFLIMRKKG